LSDLVNWLERANSRVSGTSRAWFVFAALFAVAMSFAMVTDHVWEDFYITFRSSRNLSLGNGLVYSPGERVQSFTSPLGVLLPAVLDVLTGRSDRATIWFFRILSAACYGLAGVYISGLARQCKLGRIPTILVLLLFATDAKTVDFSTNGMETGLQMLFLSMSVHALVAQQRRVPIRLGLAWAGLMWTRPDGWVYICALSFASLLFPKGLVTERPRRQLGRELLLAGCLAAAAYLPWFAFAWLYYGNPVPHTVLAKGANLLTEQSRLDHLLGHAALLVNPSVFEPVFTPAYSYSDYFVGTIASAKGALYFSRYMASAASGLAWSCAWLWVVPFVRRRTAALSFSFMLGAIYLFRIVPGAEPWYLPSCTLLAIVTIGFAFQDLLDFVEHVRVWLSAPSARVARAEICALALAIGAGSITFLVSAARQFSVQQEIIHDANKTRVGLWLKANARSKTDTVFLEPLGYVGFASGLKMFDYPGLASPEVLAARRSRQSDDYAKLIGALEPDWVVLRPSEAASVRQDDPDLLDRRYRLSKVFDVSPEVAATKVLPGRAYLEFDQCFQVFARNAD
jgi:hypothetical protein